MEHISTVINKFATLPRPFKKPCKEAIEEQEKMEEMCRLGDIRRLLAVSNLPQFNSIKKLEDIEPKNKEQRNLVKRLSDWDYSLSFRLPYIYGPPGCGKTFIAMSFARTVIEKFLWTTRFCTVSQVLINYRDFNVSKSVVKELIDPVVLVMDDFGANNFTQYSMELLHYVIDHRVKFNKPTVITSNMAINEVSKHIKRCNGVNPTMCDALEDRLFELCGIVSMSGQSIRIQDALVRLKQ